MRDGTPLITSTPPPEAVHPSGQRGDIYADWDIDQLTATMADVLAEDLD